MATVAVWLLLFICAAGSAAGAFAWRDSIQTQARQQFDKTATDVSASMGAALRRDTDFVASMRATLTGRPDMTNAEFSQWMRSVGAATRYPGGVVYAYVEQVPAAQLADVAAKLTADRPPTAEKGPFAVFPPGPRADYCLLRLGVSLGFPAVPLGYDVCAAPSVPGLLASAPGVILRAAADAGETTVVPLDIKQGIFGVAAAVYRGGPAPATPAARRAALVGWVTATFNGPGMLADGGGVRAGLRVAIVHQNPGAAPVVLAATGSARRGSPVRDTHVAADGSWTVQVSGTVTTGGLSPTAQFWIVLATGLTLSGLLFAFVQVLARGRERALRQVERKTAELHHMALHDALTGLPNRALLLDRVEQALARARRHDGQIAVLFLDLDGFKGINDTFGHAAGDQLLRSVAARLSGVLRDSDTVGRLGGDEFIILLDQASMDAGPELVAERIRAVLAEPFTLDDAEHVRVTTRASIGIAVGLRDNAPDLLRDADVALYEAKTAGKDCFITFAPAMQVAVQDRLELEMDLRDALGTDQFFLVYQPTFDLSQGTITGVEALLRWQHPSRGLIMPERFIPVAEETGLIVPLGRWVLTEATRQAARWREAGHPLSISINVSARQLDHDLDFLSDVQTALDASGLDPGTVTLEITESTLMRDAAGSARRLHALKALGVRIAIDDFGTGYSSLSYLQQFPVDALKIDRSFISSISGSPESTALIRTLVQLGKTLGIETLAEGIEEQAQLARLQREQCDSGQGYLFARPLSATALEGLLGFSTDTPRPASTKRLAPR